MPPRARSSRTRNGGTARSPAGRSRIARCRGRPDRRAIPAHIRSRDNANKAPRRARAGRGEEANWSGARWAETAGVAWIGALCGAPACRTTLRSREPARNRGQRLVVLTVDPCAFHLFRRDALGYDGAGGRSMPRGGGPLAVERTCLAIVLAAGEGTRMRSTRPKVLHAIAGQSLLAHVLDAVRKAGGTMTAVVVGLGADAVAAEAKRVLPDAEIFVQAQRRGTAHAVLAAKAAIGRAPDDVLVIFGDTPLIRPQTLTRIREALAEGAAVVVLGFRSEDPSGYGRLVVEDGELVAIREEVDASPAEGAITLCNGGLMAFAGPTALAILEQIGNQNRKGEYYLTDAVAIARAMGCRAIVIETEEDDVRGINTNTQLAETATVLQQRLRKAAMEGGVTLIAPETVFLSSDTKFGREVVVEPFVVFGPGVTV